MRRRLLIAMLLAGFGGSSAGPLAAQEAKVIELTAPRMPGPDEGAEVQIIAGRLAPGARIELLAEQGESYGALAPFGPARGGAATATVPIPRSALVNGRLRLRVRVIERGAAPRAPRPEEIESLTLVLAPQSR
ncbi:MAG: hypothetical protein ACXWM1_14415 [Candidatus Binataceae bacterium]